MRRILTLGLLIFICTAFACSVHAVKTAPVSESEIYTYDGEYDPVSFFDWDRIEVKICEKGHHHFFMSNPNPDVKPKVVELITVKSEDKYIVIGYAYLKNNITYFFFINKATKRYMQIEFELDRVKNLRIK